MYICASQVMWDNDLAMIVIGWKEMLGVWGLCIIPNSVAGSTITP